MILAIDSGNTNVLFTLLRDGEAVASWRRAVDDRRTADEDGVWLLQLMNLKGTKPADITGVIAPPRAPSPPPRVPQRAQIMPNLDSTFLESISYI